ncbi:MAG: N-acetyl-gamma-glutamyl-phosphate reductase [Treponema sp.]|nr:N-acetyl-gamma-glutamyl-phosphate reductase [Treponema sp.]MCL2191629.1 N-acetyl-gamma-glutamyl-phosphate reductase [Treponema sp.]
MRAGVIGATGYAGAELVRLLASHPNVDDLVLSSVSFEGENIDGVYPGFLGRISLPLGKADDVVAAADVVFSALPHGVGEPHARDCVGRGVPFIDLSADFRFGDDEATFSAWYGKPYLYPELHEHSVYGLPEMNRDRIRRLAGSGKAIVGNPGCYPTGAAIGIFPALAKGLVAKDGGAPIIVDAASGTSGGGREPARSFHHPECADSVSPYKVGGTHRHTPEIARSLAAMAAPGSPPHVIFTPHLAPMNRGILSTIYIPLSASWETGEGAAAIHAVYADFYRDEPFVRVLPPGAVSATNRVRNSNYCDVSVHLDRSGRTLIVVSAIDNMVKGAAGQAVQNMNLLFGFDESAGLGMIPLLF